MEIIIDNNHVESTSGMQGWFKIKKFINLINYST